MKKGLLFCFVLFFLSSCVSKKQYKSIQDEVRKTEEAKGLIEQEVANYTGKLSACEKEKSKLQNELKALEAAAKVRKEQIADLKVQLEDSKKVRDKQLTQVGDLTVLSQSASQNIKETLSQLERKDKYIHLLQMAKTKADSINLALAVNLKSVLKDGVSDDDIEIKVDKTVVFINLSDKMLFESGSSSLTERSKTVLAKIATIVSSRPDLEVMVEGYTDNVPISKECFEDNWDLSAKRATSVVRTLQVDFKVNPNKLIAAGRGEYNALADNSTPEGRATNRRTRIIILPKLNQFYDLLNPNSMPK